MFGTTFDIENEKRERTDNAISAAVAVGIHALLLLLFLWFTISLPNPPFEEDEGGMAINFGTSDVGEGDVQPMNYTPTQQQFSPEEKSASAPTQSEESIVTQDNEETVAMPTKKEPVKPEVKKPKPVEDALFKPTAKNTTQNTQKTSQPTVDDNSLFRPGAVGAPNNSKGDGEGKGKGDQGDPNGDPNSRSYVGGGSGNGTGTGNENGGGNWKLAGRKLMRPETPKNPCEEKRGKVNIEIKVNQSGKVTSAKFIQGGSTTSDECLVNVAKQAAMRYSFDAKSDAAEVQTGSILFTFKEN